ncbi:MAG TPA: acyl-CoA dehydrogenase family protein, partial [Caulobacteraceae bacterium]|nr:acyl-CoA dehydrogenase family protein [Caulobacteraceae bacterium]
GEDFWCQGYSEPDAGSDLAALQMSAVEDGDDLVCNGHKLWTTFAHAANWIFCLVRTAREGPPQRGVTFVLIDMTSPGVEVRPIVMLTGEHIQNHVFFSDVRVPKANVVGAIGEGWSVAKYLMEFERGGAIRAPSLRARLERLEAAARDMAEPDLLTRLADAAIELDAFEALERRALSRPAANQRPPAEASLLKVLVTELGQRLTEIATDLAGVYAAPWQPHAARPGGPTPGFSAPDFVVGPEQSWTAAARYFNDRAASIYGGTNEIQRNIIGRTLA